VIAEVIDSQDKVKSQAPIASGYEFAMTFSLEKIQSEKNLA
jgi:hypothetical protein